MSMRAGEATLLRRELGPVAWVTLEVLVGSGEPQPAGTVLTRRTGAQVAADVGVNRDTAVAALNRLRRRSLVTFTAERTSGGRFASGHYVITVEAVSAVAALSRIVVERASSERPSSVVAPVAKRRGVSGQASLLDLVGDVSGAACGGGGVRHEFASSMPSFGGPC